MEPVGAHVFHGFSAALDLQQVSRTALGSSFPAGDGPLRILLLQPGDPRSVLKTIAQRFRHSKRPLHVRARAWGRVQDARAGLTPPPSRVQFYVYERPLEGVARHVLLLAVATDLGVPLRVRAATYLEVFGNALVQARTARYVSSLRAPLIEVLCGGGGASGGAPALPLLAGVVDLQSLLRHKQRDELEGVLKAWDERAPYDAALYRDTRVRAQHGVRYDARTNLFDWDYQGVVKPAAGCVHWRQYRDWRERGVAFEFGDQVYDAPNRSLGSYVEGRERVRGSVLCRGFWGDLVVSPFHALGTAAYVPTDDEAAAARLAAATCGGGGGGSGNHAATLFDITNRRSGSEQWRHHAGEVATYNVVSWLHELETGRVYIMQAPHDVHSGLQAEPAVGEEGDAPAIAPPAAVTMATAAAAAAVAVAEAGAALGSTAAAALPSAPAVPQPQPTAVAADVGLVAAAVRLAAAGEGAAADADAAGATGAGAGAAAPPVPAPPLTAEQAARVAAEVSAGAAARARAVSRALRGVRVTFLAGGDFVEDFCSGGARGKQLEGLFHVVALSGRAVHHLAAPAFVRVLAPGGAVIIAETARNIPTLTPEQRAEYARRVMGMAARCGCVLLGGDRALSADTFAVGTVIDLAGAADHHARGAAAAASSEAVLHLDTPASGALPGLPAPLASTTFAGVSALGGGATADGAGARRPLNVKALGMEPFSFADGPLPPAAALVRAAQQHGAGSGGGEDPLAAAATTAAAAAAYIRGVATHDARGGDNPFPEALVFAALPPPIAHAVAAAFVRMEEAVSSRAAAAAGAAP